MSASSASDSGIGVGETDAAGPGQKSERWAQSPAVEPQVDKHDSVAATEKPKLQIERRQKLEHQIRSNPTDLDLFLELAQIYRGEQKFVEARRVMQQAASIFPDEPQVLWELEEATLSRSIQQLREVADLANRLDTVETGRELARCQQDWAMRRIEVCRARLARDASLVHLRMVLAEALYDAGEYELAIVEADSVLDNDDLSPAANLLRGRCLLATGKDVDAMGALRALRDAAHGRRAGATTSHRPPTALRNCRTAGRDVDLRDVSHRSSASRARLCQNAAASFPLPQITQGNLMSQAVVDPDQLRQFASHLHRFAEEMKQRSAGLATQMNQLEQTWRDEQQRKFAEEFTTQMRQMARLIQTTEEHVPYLMRKAEQIDAYLGR